MAILFLPIDDCKWVDLEVEGLELYYFSQVMTCAAEVDYSLQIMGTCVTSRYAFDYTKN